MPRSSSHMPFTDDGNTQATSKAISFKTKGKASSYKKSQKSKKMKSSWVSPLLERNSHIGNEKRKSKDDVRISIKKTPSRDHSIGLRNSKYVKSQENIQITKTMTTNSFISKFQTARKSLDKNNAGQGKIF